MDPRDREHAIETYLRALDEESYDQLRTVFAEEVVYRFPGRGDRTGLDDVLDYFEHVRPSTGTSHEVRRYIHDDTVSVCEGRFSGTVAGEPAEHAFCDVFEYDHDRELVTAITVYTHT